MSKPKRLTLPYTAADLRLMRQLAKQKKSAREAAKVLGRTRGAVAYKAMVEGIHFRAIAQPAGVQRRRFRKTRARRAA